MEIYRELMKNQRMIYMAYQLIGLLIDESSGVEPSKGFFMMIEKLIDDLSSVIDSLREIKLNKKI